MNRTSSFGLGLVTVGLFAWGILGGEDVQSGGPPAGFFPSGMSNVALRYETYCLAGIWPCVEVFIPEYGQTCHAPVKGGSPYYDGFIPPGFTYVRWRCTLSPEQAVGGVKVRGEGYE